MRPATGAGGVSVQGYSEYMHVSEIETPALVVDLDQMERNLSRAAGYARQHGLRLRPHTKTHKSVRMGRRQLELGAAGLTVAKVSEAEVMVEAGPSDLLVAYPIVGRAKLERLMAVARKTRAAQVEIGVLAEFDAGLGRVGVEPGAALIDLAQGIRSLPHLAFEGIAFYPGHIKDLDEGGLRALAQLSELTRSIGDDFRRAAIEVKIMSGGSTPTLFHSHDIEGLTEIRPGTYIYNDVNTVRSGGCTLEDCAATILATVVSTARAGQMIIDGGSKTFSSDRPVNSPDPGFGHVVEAPGAKFHKMNEEHGFIDLAR